MTYKIIGEKYRTVGAAQYRARQLNDAEASVQNADVTERAVFGGGAAVAISSIWEAFPTNGGLFGIRRSNPDVRICTCDVGQALRAKEQAARAKEQAICPKCSGRGKIMFQKVLGEWVDVPWDDQPNFGWRTDTCARCNGSGKRAGTNAPVGLTGVAKPPVAETPPEKGRLVHLNDDTEFPAVSVEQQDDNMVFVLPDGKKKTVKKRDIFWMKKQAVAPAK